MKQSLKDDINALRLKYHEKLGLDKSKKRTKIFTEFVQDLDRIIERKLSFQYVFSLYWDKRLFVTTKIQGDAINEIALELQQIYKRNYET